MDIKVFFTLLGAIGGLGGIAGIITAISNAVTQYRNGKKASIEEQVKIAIQPILEEQREQRLQLNQIQLDTTRTQLYMKMEHEPHNHDTILKIAHRYFVELKGDWVATADFQAWADQEKLKIPSAIMQAIAENDRIKQSCYNWLITKEIIMEEITPDMILEQAAQESKHVQDEELEGK